MCVIVVAQVRLDKIVAIVLVNRLDVCVGIFAEWDLIRYLCREIIF